MRLFGTDGIRGIANVYPITSEVFLRIASIVGSIVYDSCKIHNNDENFSAVIAKDTRESGSMLESALSAGFMSVGFNVFMVGDLPTPVTSFITQSMAVNIGCIVSASHNKFCDNGLKFFDYNGRKFTDEMETKVEKLFYDQQDLHFKRDKIGKIYRSEDAKERYIQHIKNQVPSLCLNGYKIVVDCANGATYKIVPIIFQELGANVIIIGNNPDGTNINDQCGSNNPKFLKNAVIANRADYGIAFDGDGDRVIVCDRNGKCFDGDYILSILSANFMQLGKINISDPIIGTIMSNSGLENYVEKMGLRFIRSKVGDKYVEQVMQEKGAKIGGEPSGHIIISENSPTSDGVSSVLHLFDYLYRTKIQIGHIPILFSPVPQQTKTISVQDKNIIYDELFQKDLTEIASSIVNGRFCVRASGTENAIRIMVEHENINQLNKLMELLEKNVRNVERSYIDRASA